MDKNKREFLKKTAKLAVLSPIAAIVPTEVIAGDNRLFGTPASISPMDPNVANKLKLSFSNACIPTELWQELEIFISGINNLNKSDVAKSEFNKSPRAYFESIGLKTTPKFNHSKEVAMARLATDSIAQSAAVNGDYKTLIQRIKEYNLPTIPDSEGLASKLATLMRKDVALYGRIKDIVDKSGVSDSQFIQDTLKATNITINNQNSRNDADVVSTSPNDDTSIGVSMNILVASDIVALSEAIVAVHTITIAAIASIVALVVIAFGQDSQPDVRYHGKLISGLDANIIEGAATTVRAARMLGNTGFEVQIATEMVHREIEAIFLALEELGLINFDFQQRTEIIANCKNLAVQRLGLRA